MNVARLLRTHVRAESAENGSPLIISLERMDVHCLKGTIVSGRGIWLSWSQAVFSCTAWGGAEVWYESLFFFFVQRFEKLGPQAHPHTFSQAHIRHTGSSLQEIPIEGQKCIRNRRQVDSWVLRHLWPVVSRPLGSQRTQFLDDGRLGDDVDPWPVGNTGSEARVTHSAPCR